MRITSPKYTTRDSLTMPPSIPHRNKPLNPKIGKRTKGTGAVIHAIAIPLTALYTGRGVRLYGVEDILFQPLHKERKMTGYSFAIAPNYTGADRDTCHTEVDILRRNSHVSSTKPCSCERRANDWRYRSTTVEYEFTEGSAVRITHTYSCVFVPPVNPKATVLSSYFFDPNKALSDD